MHNLKQFILCLILLCPIIGYGGGFSSGAIQTLDNVGDVAVSSGVDGECLRLQADLTWANESCPGAGTVSGPGVSTDDALVVWDGITGDTLKDSSVDISELVVSGDMSAYLLADGSRSVSGNLSLSGNTLQNIANGTLSDDAMAYGQLTTHISADDHTQYLLADGSRSVSDNLSLSGNTLQNIANGTLSTDAMAYGQLTTHQSADDHTIYLLADGTRSVSGDLSLSGNTLMNIANGTQNTDAVAYGQLSSYLLADGSTSVTGTLDLGEQSIVNTTIWDSITGLIESPTDNKNSYEGYVIDEYAAGNYTINSLAIRTSDGTVNATLQIEGVSVTGCTSIGVTSAQSVNTCSASNAVTAGDTLTLLFDGSATPTDASFTVDIDKEL